MMWSHATVSVSGIGRTIRIIQVPLGAVKRLVLWAISLRSNSSGNLLVHWSVRDEARRRGHLARSIVS